MSAIEMLKEQMSRRDTLLCVGLDPEPDRLPAPLGAGHINLFLDGVVGATAQFACAFKPNLAFFLELSDGPGALRRAVARAHDFGTPIIVDCKVGETGNSMRKYREFVFDHIGADGIVVNPYMGDEVFEGIPPDKICVVLVRTSNSGSAVVQEMMAWDGLPLWRHVLDLAVNRWNRNGNIIPVISATAELDFDVVRAAIPDEMVVLLAGFGAQGGDISVLPRLLDSKGGGVIVNSSREILYPRNTVGLPWATASAEAAYRARELVNAARRRLP